MSWKLPLGENMEQWWTLTDLLRSLPASERRAMLAGGSINQADYDAAENRAIVFNAGYVGLAVDMDDLIRRMAYKVVFD